MISKRLHPSQIKSVLKENLGRQDIVFVFATDIALTTWAEWCIKNPQESGTNAVALEQFIAWDKFKEKYLIARDSDKQSIPSTLRKVFVHNLILENAQKAKEDHPLFKSIINPKFADDAVSFTSWISTNLSSLKEWNSRFTEHLKQFPEDFDDEDKDYQLIYKRYKEFLGDKLFEPSWLEPNFTEQTKQFIIFYPEQLQDYCEYEKIFSQTDKITEILLPEIENSTEAAKLNLKLYKYSDSRKELRRTCLLIRQLAEEKQIPYYDIAVHVPEIESYRPYIERDFTNYCIPYVVRSGNKLTENSAGCIFENIQNCKQNNYSYDSLRNLLLNGFVPWKSPELNESLIRKGKEYHCLCNYEDDRKKDVWFKALLQTKINENETKHYSLLKNSIEALCNSRTFEAVKTSWFTFKSEFMKEDGFSPEADNILGRCISELENLIQLEKDYFEDYKLSLDSPFDFFIQQIQEKTYQPQQELSGVSIFNYKLAACSAFKYNFIINCSQKAVSIEYKHLNFLNSKKRKALGLIDQDIASKAFLQLYGKFNTQNEQPAIFSCSENTLTGFAIPHTFLDEVQFEKNHSPFEELDKNDFMLNEKNFFMSNTAQNPSAEPQEFTLQQKNQFENWKFRSDSTKFIPQNKQSSLITEKINFALYENRSGDKITDESLTGTDYENEKAYKDSSIMKISQSDMANFFPCQRNWLFKNIFHLHDDSLDLNLFENYDKGNINHKILELLFTKLKILPVTQENSTFGEKEQEIYELTKECFHEAINDFSMNFTESPIVMKVLENSSDDFVNSIMNFMHEFCDPKEHFGGYKVYAVEKKLTCKDPALKFAYMGKIDCLLVNDEGNIVIIDYKNSQVPSIISCTLNIETNAIKNFQCAMYVTLWDLSSNTAEISKMYFHSITNPDSSRDIINNQKKSRTYETYKDTLKRFTEYAQKFYSLILNSNLQPSTKDSAEDNKVDVYSDCISCHFKSICRTTYNVARKEI